MTVGRIEGAALQTSGLRREVMKSSHKASLDERDDA
jgi:hypothetical protein